MHQDSKRTCTAIVLFIKPFVWCRSRHRRRPERKSCGFENIRVRVDGALVDFAITAEFYL